MKEKNNLSGYVDTAGQLSNTQLKISSWYLRHEILLQQIGTGVLIGFCVFTVGFSLFFWGKYLFIDYWQDQKILKGQVQEFQNYAQLQNAYKAADIEILETQVYNSAPNMYDFFALAVNPNERWIAHIDYHFIYSGNETKVYRSSIIPGSRRPLAVFGAESETYPGEARFVIDKIDWEAIDPHKIFDVTKYMGDRLMFNFNNFVFKPPSKTGASVPSVVFDIFNDSAYSFWDAVFYVELLNDNQTVGYIYLSIPKFLSQEKRPIDLRYFGENLTVTDVKVIPALNVFDKNIYIRPQGEIQ